TTRPTQKYTGASLRMTSSPAITTSVMNDQNAKDRRRVPRVSERWPIIGVTAKITNPATVMATDSHCAGVREESICAPTELVRYTAKINVTSTALNAAEPQSHMAQEKTVSLSVRLAELGKFFNAWLVISPNPTLYSSNALRNRA